MEQQQNYQVNSTNAEPMENKNEAKKEEQEEEQIVTPFEVSAAKGIDYDKLINKFGCQRLEESLVDRVVRLTGRSHIFLRRNIFFAHRDFNEILDSYERGGKFYLYTGRGPSSEALHLGHLIPFFFTKYLQESFKVPLVIQMSDDEKFLCKDLTVEEVKRLVRENVKDIIACGFDKSRTFIFSNIDYGSDYAFRVNILKVSKYNRLKKAASIFGLSEEDSSGKINYPAVQAAPTFPSSFPHLFSSNDNLRCLIPCAIDQDPYFRLTRDIAPKLGFKKPATIEAIFLPALQGESGKMSASDPNSAIYVTDSRKDIKNKINRLAFTGRQDTVEKHRKQGANLEVDIPFKYLSYFLEDDDELEHIRKEYGSGRMLTGEVKSILIDVLANVVERHRKAREAVTDEMVDDFMKIRPLPDMFEM